MTHGRVLVREARAAARRGVLVGFHGYMENAKTPDGAARGDSRTPLAWTLVSIQGLHRFYRGRTEDVVASWMTREDRELAIADNLAYVSAALEQVPHDPSTRVVYTGFSQGVAMAFRAGVLGARAGRSNRCGRRRRASRARGTIRRFDSRGAVSRGSRDEWLTESRFERDVAALRSRAVAVEPHVYDGAHEWNLDVSDAIGDFLLPDLTRTCDRIHSAAVSRYVDYDLLLLCLSARNAKRMIAAIDFVEGRVLKARKQRVDLLSAAERIPPSLDEQHRLAMSGRCASRLCSGLPGG